MLVARSAHPLAFIAAGVRTNDSYDAATWKHGVEVYKIEQRCPNGGVCDGPGTLQLAPRSRHTGAREDLLRHVLVVGESVTVHGVTFTVVFESDGDYTVEVSGDRPSFPVTLDVA